MSVFKCLTGFNLLVYALAYRMLSNMALWSRLKRSAISLSLPGRLGAFVKDNLVLLILRVIIEYDFGYNVFCKMENYVSL